MFRHPARIAIAAVAAMTFIACADATTQKPDAAPDSPSPTTSASTGAADVGSSFDSIDEVATALKEGGMACTDVTTLGQPNPTLKEFALCDIGDANGRLSIYLFKNEKRRNGWMGGMVEAGLPWMFGPNWIIVGSGDPATAEERLLGVQRAIGGQFPDVVLDSARPRTRALLLS